MFSPFTIEAENYGKDRPRHDDKKMVLVVEYIPGSKRPGQIHMIPLSILF